MTTVLERPTLAELLSGYKRAPNAVLNSKKSGLPSVCGPQVVKCRFIEPGLVDYTDIGLGMVLVQRPFLDKVRQTFVGKAVIDEVHKDAKPENFKEIADGAVIRVWNEPADGWDWAEFLVWDDETYRHTKDPNYFVSCAYDPTKMDRNGGRHHAVAYDGEFLDGEYTHLAIVKDPRYEGARIVWNSTGAKPMKDLFKIFRAPAAPAEEVAELNGKETFLEVDGEKISVANAVEIVRAENARKAAAAKNAGPMGDADTVEIDGVKMTGKQIKLAIANAKKAKNKKEGEEGEDAGDQSEAEESEKEEGKKRDKGEAKNAVKRVLALDLDKDAKVAVLNSLAKKKEYAGEVAQEAIAEALNGLGAETDHIGEFREAAEMRNNQPGVPSITTQVDRLKLGDQMFGNPKKEAA